MALLVKAMQGAVCVLEQWYAEHISSVKRHFDTNDKSLSKKTAPAGSDVVQSGRLIFDDFFQHLWPYIGNNTANVVFQMVKRLRLIRIDQ
ncbi:hypothetical protein TNCV_4495721 [Trichonephila clavipes]|nr:hypothetical protein TNCV_4495721 [Trichonephila clavipes]